MRARHTFTTTVLAFFLLLSSGYGKAAQRYTAAVAVPAAAAAKPVAAEPVAPPPPVVIPLGDIATRATEVSNVLANLTASAAPSAQIETIGQTLPDLSDKLDVEFAITTKTLEAEPTLDVLQSLQQDWQRHELAAKRSLSALTLKAAKLQQSLNQITDLQKTWGNTRASAQQAKAPAPILQQIDATLAAITAAQAKLQSERAALLDLQSRVAREVNKCDTILAQIDQIQHQAVAGIFVATVPPIWRMELWPDAINALPGYLRGAGSAQWSEIVKYLREPHQGSALHAALFIVLAVVFCAARRKLAAWEKSGVAASSAILVFKRPYAAALATTLMFVTSPFFQVPTVARQFLTILMLVPMLRVARPMLTASGALVSSTFCFLLAIDTLRQTFSGLRTIGLMIIVAETLAAILVLFRMRRHNRQIIAGRAESSGLLLKAGRFPLMIVLLVALAAGAAGYTRLAQFLTPGILVGAVLALAAFTMLRVFSGAIALALRLWPLRLLRMVEHQGDLLERRVNRVLVWGAIFTWSVRYLYYLGLLDTAWSLGHAVLATKLERGTIAISLGNVLEFFLAIWLAHLLSRFLRFVLQEDVYPRIDLNAGLSYAASSVLNYIILALGFVVGLGLLGVDFAKVSILAGAFGVGIGFGLQSIVNNFVSGLILLFERPIHVGDTVEVANLQGTVRRIGIRASVIHTAAGADIIVPNSQLITDKVTNWTFSDRLRRVDLPIGVNYGAEPQKVIELLEQVAQAHSDVLAAPAPRAIFVSYGDNSINFELQVWPSRPNLSTQVRNDLASAVYHAVLAAGMSFPLPQREVRLLRDGDDGASASGGSDKKASPGRA